MALRLADATHSLRPVEHGEPLDGPAERSTAGTAPTEIRPLMSHSYLVPRSRRVVAEKYYELVI